EALLVVTAGSEPPAIVPVFEKALRYSYECNPSPRALDPCSSAQRGEDQRSGIRSAIRRAIESRSLPARSGRGLRVLARIQPLGLAPRRHRQQCLPNTHFLKAIRR